jgi:flagellar hook-length control protein FliK
VFYVIQPIVTGQLGKNSTGKSLEKEGNSTSDFDAILKQSVETGENKEVNVEILGLLTQVFPFAATNQPASSNNMVSELTKKLPDKSLLIETPFLIPKLVPIELPPKILEQAQQVTTGEQLSENLKGQGVGNSESVDINSVLDLAVLMDKQSSLENQLNMDLSPRSDMNTDFDNPNSPEVPSQNPESIMKNATTNTELSSDSQQQEQPANISSSSNMMVEESNINEQQTFIHPVQTHTQQAPQDIQNKQAVINTPVTVTQFEQDMTKFIESAVRVGNVGDGVEATFSLSPEHLGKVDVKLSIIDGNVTAEFFTSTSSGRDVLELNVQALRTALETQGFQVDKINISQQNLSSFMGSFSQKGESNGRQAQQDSKKRQVQNIQNLDTEYQHLDLDTGSKINTTA